LLPILKKHTKPLNEEIEFSKLIDASKQSFEKLKIKVKGNELKRMKKPRFFDFIAMIVFFPVYLMSLILHSPAIATSKFIVNKKVTSHEFKSPVFISIMVFFNLFVLMISLLLIPIFKTKVFVFLLFYGVIGILGVYYLKFFEDKWAYLFASNEVKVKLSSESLSFSNQ